MNDYKDINENNSNNNKNLLSKNKLTYFLKIIILGDISVEKTFFINSYINNTLSEEDKKTISYDYVKKNYIYI